MHSSTGSTCPLCQGKIRREEKAAPERSADIIDCGRCGIYELGRGTRAQLVTTLRDEPYIRAKAALIRPANEKGYVFAYPDGPLIPGHRWLTRG